MNDGGSMKRFFSLLLVIVGMLPLAVLAASEVALVTSVEGKVNGATGPLSAFAKLSQGETLTLSSNAKVALVFLGNGRQENWAGKGRLEIKEEGGHSSNLPPPTSQQLPLIMVKQLARTPGLDSQERAGALRLRSAAVVDAVARVDATYRQAREVSPANDRTPELYLLSGLFELRQYNRVAEVLQGLREKYPDSMEVQQLSSRYLKALQAAKQDEESGR